MVVKFPATKSTKGRTELGFLALHVPVGRKSEQAKCVVVRVRAFYFNEVIVSTYVFSTLAIGSNFRL